MQTETRALLKALIAHHDSVRALHPVEGEISDSDIKKKYTISYTDLCEKSGTTKIAKEIDKYLRPLSELCDARTWPPIHSLAVSSGSRTPSQGYEKLSTWAEDVRACIRFEGYKI